MIAGDINTSEDQIVNKKNRTRHDGASVISTMWEAEIRRIILQGHPCKKLVRPYIN
jgi:hypothetical protein